MAWKDTTSRRAGTLPKNWKSLRAQILARDNHTCVQCGQPATDVDHIADGNNHNPNNLRSLCRTCHMRKTGRDGGRAPHKPRLSTKRPPEPHPGIKPQEGENQ